MSYLISNVPHFKCWVRKEFTCNHLYYHGEYLHALAFAVNTIPFRSLSFQSASSTASQVDALASSYQIGSPRWGVYGVSISGGPTTGSGAAYTVGDQIKVGIRYQDGLTPSDDENTVICVNGTLGTIDTDHDVHSSERVWIGSNGGTNTTNKRKLNGTINRLTIWKTPFVDSKLQRLTS